MLLREIVCIYLDKHMKLVQVVKLGVNFDILLTVHLNIFILILTNLMH